MFLDHDAAINRIIGGRSVWRVTLTCDDPTVHYISDSHDKSLVGTLAHALYGYSVRHGSPERVEEVQIRRVQRDE